MSTLAARGFVGWLARIEDGAILRVAFFVMLAGVLSVLYLDYRELSENDAMSLAAPREPVLPAFDPDGAAPANAPAVTSDYEALREPLRVVLGPGGILSLTGTIDPGAAQRVADEVAARGEYVTTVSFDSPGGSVEDAVAIGRLLAEKSYATRVAAGALCASSCPLAFAGGRERVASAQSAIGVHQVYASELATGARAAGEAMADAQRTTATITRYLTEMGVDPAVWLHALETPPTRLYYLTPDELEQYRLATTLQ